MSEKHSKTIKEEESMDVKKLNETLDEVLKLNEAMRIKADVLMGGYSKTAKEACKDVLTKHQARVNYLTKNNRKERQILSVVDKPEHTACRSTVKMFEYNNNDYYFVALWGEEDIYKLDKNGNRVLNKQKQWDILKGHALAHILVMHQNHINDILNNIDNACTTINVNKIYIEKDPDGTDRLVVENDAGNIHYVFKECKEIAGNYFYLHTAY